MLRAMDALVATRLAAQGLAGTPAATPHAVVERLLAVQAQDARAFRLAIRSRSVGLAATDVDAALGRRELVVSWLNRGTLHLVAAADLPWLHALTAPRLATSTARRLRQEGVGPADAERGVRVIAEAVRGGPQPPSALRTLLDRAGVPTAGQAVVHLLGAATIAGHVVRGPVLDGEHAFVDVRAWLGEHAPVVREDALARLARRYLVGHGPASADDLAYWSGLPLGDARRGLATIAEETEPWEDGRVALAAAPSPGIPAPRLLGAFDPVLHGWRSRAPIVGDDETGVVTSNGIFRPTALVDGRVVATWGLAGGLVAIRPREPIDEAARSALLADAQDVLRYLGLPPRAAVVEGALSA